MNKAERFSIYKHNFVYGNNLIVTKQFIVLCHSDGTKTFTNFHKYAVNPNRKIKKFNEDGNNRFIFINKFLNYAFFTEGISSLSELTVDVGRRFLNAYGMHELPDDDEYVHREKGTVEKSVKAVLDFYINLINDKDSGCKIKSADLYKVITVRNKYGKAIKKTIPQFDVNYISGIKEPIYRDIPNKAFVLLFDHIATNHTDLLGLVMHQAFAGLRPSEACNVRRMDSPLGAGIRIKEINGRLCGVTIDLRDELNLRSDLLTVGGIKKERIAKVPDIFLSAYKDIAFINLMQEGAAPVTAMLLGGHTNIEMASHYYSNVVSFIECKTYRQYRKQLSGDVQYKLSHTSKLPPAGIPCPLSDGGLCYSDHYKNGSITDCLMASGPNGEIGYCPECNLYRKDNMSYFSGDDIYKRHIEQDSKELFLAMQSVMEGKGNTENIKEAILRLNSSNYSYKAYLEQKLIHESEDN